jgi:protein SCO1
MRRAILISILAFVAACSAPDRHEYQLQGQVLSVAADHKEANIKHQDIPGFMPAMTMPYKVRDPQQYANLVPGDLITATLVVVSNEAYLKDVKKIGNAPLDPKPSPAPAASSGFELLKPGEAVPNTVFIDQDTKVRDFASFKNSVVLMTFIYTKCPLPDFCPLMDRNFKTIQARLDADPSLKNVHLVSVSFDPATDTPQVLKMHAGALGADPKRWTFLTGQRDDIDQFAMRFGVAITREMNDPTNITHNLRTVIVDKQGQFVKAYTGNEWKPDEIIADLKKIGG